MQERTGRRAERLIDGLGRRRCLTMTRVKNGGVENTIFGHAHSVSPDVSIRFRQSVECRPCLSLEDGREREQLGSGI